MQVKSGTFVSASDTSLPIHSNSKESAWTHPAYNTSQCNNFHILHPQSFILSSSKAISPSVCPYQSISELMNYYDPNSLGWKLLRYFIVSFLMVVHNQEIKSPPSSLFSADDDSFEFDCFIFELICFIFEPSENINFL